MRKSLESAQNPVAESGACYHNISDSQSVDTTPGLISNIVGLFIRFWWISAVMIGCLAFAFPYIFPEMEKEYSTELGEIRDYSNTGKFIRNVQNIDWKKALSDVSLEQLTLIGTGRHKIFKETPELKEHWFYPGNDLLMMKHYVTNFEYGGSIQYQGEHPDIYLPAVDFEYGEAAEYCSGLGNNYRLPTYSELRRAYYYKMTKQTHGGVGKLLKSNLELGIIPEVALWTSTPQGDSFMRGTYNNYRVFMAGRADGLRFEDEDFNSETLGFLCVRQLENDENSRF